jgi:hypothetical protein
MIKYLFTLIILFLTNLTFAGQFITKWQLNPVLPSFDLDLQIPIYLYFIYYYFIF